MFQSLWQKFKRVKMVDFYHIFLFVAAIPVSIFYRIAHRNLWLFCDSAKEARDNGYWLYRYVREEHPEVDAIFAIDYNSMDYERAKMVGPTVHFGSFKHWVLYLSARHVVSSQKASGPNPSVCYVLDRFRIYKGNKVFLQHGIIKDDIPFLYYCYTNIRLFTCSTQRELDYVESHFGYPQGHVQLLGLCRFDELLKPCKIQRTILIMPTWRRWLSQPMKGIMPSQLDEQFQTSSYLKHWNGLINDPIFLELLELYDLNAVFYLHRDAQRYSDYFESRSPRLRIGIFPQDDVQVLLKTSEILITDYSSVAMDFALLGRPLFYYQFDYEEFRKGHWGEGYFDYTTDGFGPVCRTQEELVEQLKTQIEIPDSESEVYEIRRKEFFTLRDQENCKRTYEAIKQLAK